MDNRDNLQGFQLHSIISHIRPLSRRDVLKRGAALGVGGTAFATLLAACGGKSNNSTPTTGSSASTATSSSGGSTATTSSGGSTATTAAAPSAASTSGSTAVGKLADKQTIQLPESEPVSFDPGVTSGGWGLEQLQNLFEGLVGVNQTNGELEMQMAEKMEANTDASEFTFTVRDGLKWSDGSPLTAKDFEYAWKRVLTPETKSDYTSALLPLKNADEILSSAAKIDDLGVSATDDKTLKATLIGPTPYFPLLAATWTYYPIPKKAVDQFGEKWVEGGNMVSNGPYVLTEWKHDQSMALDQNPNYWGTKPTITHADYTLFSDPVAQALVSFENDEVDQAQVIGADLERAKSDANLSKLVQVFPRSGTAFLSCDCTNAPTKDVKVRQALSMVIARKTLADNILKGEYSAAPSLLPADIPGNDPSAALGEDTAKAKDLLAQAGFKDGAGIPALSLTYDSSSVTNKNVAEYLQNVWKENLGVSVELQPMEPQAFRDWRTARKTQPYGMYLSSWGSDWADPANWHNQLFASDADFYFTHWKNDQFDQLVAEARPMTDKDKRTAQYKQAEKIINTEQPVIPLYHLNRIFVIKSYVKGIVHYPILGRTYLKYIQIEQH